MIWIPSPAILLLGFRCTHVLDVPPRFQLHSCFNAYLCFLCQEHCFWATPMDHGSFSHFTQVCITLTHQREIWPFHPLCDFICPIAYFFLGLEHIFIDLAVVCLLTYNMGFRKKGDFICCISSPWSCIWHIVGIQEIFVNEWMNKRMNEVRVW